MTKKKGRPSIKNQQRGERTGEGEMGVFSCVAFSGGSRAKQRLKPSRTRQATL